MQIKRIISRLFALLIAFSAMLAFMPVISGGAYAMNNATNYERKSGPYKEDAFINLIGATPEESPTVYMHGDIYSDVPEGVTYNEKTNTLALDNFKHPEYELATLAMGDDFTIEITGDCEIGRIEILGKSYEDYITGEPFEPYFYGGSLNIAGSGTLTVNRDRSAFWGIELRGWGCESLLDISRHVSLKVYGMKDTGDPDLQATAIFIGSSSGFYDTEAITINEDDVKKPLHNVHGVYSVKGFQHEDEPAILKDYWVDSTDFEIKGDGITVIDDAEVVLGDEYLEYTGSAVEPVIMTIGGRELVKGTDYDVSFSPSNPVNSGNYKVLITGKGKFKGKTEASFKIFPSSGSTKAKAAGKTITLKYTNLKKKSLSVVKSKYVKVGSDQGTISYKITSAKKGTKSFKKSFSISKSSGKITVKKKLKKGTYTLKVKLTAKGSSNYKVTGSRTITVKIKVK